MDLLVAFLTIVFPLDNYSQMPYIVHILLHVNKFFHLCW